MSRTKKSAINSFVGITCSILSSFLSFVLQAVFIRLLGLEYSGINGLFSSILSMLNIAELGVNNAILFRLYKCIAENDEERTELFLQTYRKVCYLVASFVGFAGLCCIPFLNLLVKDVPTFPESLWSLFIVVLTTSVITHLWDYKNIMIIAKQDRYIYTIVQYSCLFLCHGLQIFFLWSTKNIYLYLLAKLFTQFLNGLISGIITKRKYNVKWKSSLSLTQNEKKDLLKDVGSLAVYKFCRTLDATIDTFLISKFVAVTMVTIYGSISMLLSALTELLGQLNDGMVASIGDLYANGNEDRIKSVFFQSYHLTFLTYGISVAVFVPFLSSFTKWWIGYTLPDTCIYVMLLNFYMYGMGMNVATFRNSMGIFVKGWKRPAFTAFFNFIFSVLLVMRFGLIGTLLGTVIARTLTLTWYDPYIVFKYGMNSSPVKYYVRYVLYLFFTMITSVGLYYFGMVLPPINGFISIIWHGILFGVISVILFLSIGSLLPEQKQLIKRIIQILKPLLRITK